MATTNNVNNNSSIYDQINSQNNRNTSTKAEDQQNKFLTLLTTQLKNQDPLNPMDNAQMTSQLAQISTVDGIERLNTTLASMMSSTSETQALQMAALVGHGALVEGKNLPLTKDGAAIGGFDLASAADRVKIEIKDGNGNVVRTINLEGQEAGVKNFVWDGKNNDGTALEAGDYTFSVTAVQGNNDVKVSALQFGYISGVVRGSKGEIGVDVGSYGRYTVDDLKQII